MSRKKISEFRAKNIIATALNLKYSGISIDTHLDLSSQLAQLTGDDQNFAVKVDQGIKGRFKKGLVILDTQLHELEQSINTLRDKGYRWILVEPMLMHEQAQERYLSIMREQNGVQIRCSEHGGVEVEANMDSIFSFELNEGTDFNHIAELTKLHPDQLKAIIELFHNTHMTMLEINPYLLERGELLILDLAIEVDTAGAYFTQIWSEEDFREYSGRELSPEENTIVNLAKKSPASFKLDVINPDGSIFLLLSGGGASITIADEIYNQGFGDKLANYGEYSGNPNTEETRLYTDSILQLLIKSKAQKKVLFIGGAVANFTDIAATFKGIIQALDQVAETLQQQSVKVFVRRGGPRQEIGLAAIEKALRKYGIFGAVHDADSSLTEAVKELLKEMQ